MTENIKELQAKLAQYEQREKDLKARLEELSDFIENASQPLHRVDADGIIIWANQAELDSLGYSKEEYLGHPIAEFHVDHDVITDILTRLANNETLLNYPSKIRCRNGEIKDVLISSNVYRKDGKFLHTRCFTRDISGIKKEEEKKAELLLKLEQNEARLRMAMETTGLGTWDYNPVSGELNWSDECKAIYGAPTDSAVDFSEFAKHVHPDDASFVLREIEKAMNPVLGGHYDLSYRILRFDNGEVRWIRAQGKVYFNASGQAIRFLGTVLDITPGKEAQEKIAQNEKLFRSIALNIPNSLIIVIDKDHRYITIEGEIMEKLGYDRKDYEGKHPTEIGSRERYEANKALYERVLAGEKFSVERKSESGEDFMVYFVPLKNENEEVYAGLIIALDITDIKKAEEKSAKLAAIVSSSDDAIISKTMEGIVTSWNDAAKRIFGYLPEEMIGQSIMKLIPPDRWGEEPQILGKIRNGERVEHFETQRMTKDGRLLDISLSISAIHDSQGKTIRISKIARDISEKKRAERAISESEEHLRLAVKAADLGTFDMNLLIGTMDWDYRCRELFGIFREGPVSFDKDFVANLHEDDRERVLNDVTSAMEINSTEGNYDVEYRTVGAEDKKLRWVRAIGKSILDENNRPARFIGTVMDITDRKLEELKKNDFIAIVSHELKTPLTSIKSYIQVLLERAKNDGDRFRIQALTRAEIQANKMASMIQDFLSLARLEEGKINLNMEVFDLNPLMEDVIAEALFLTSNHTIEINHCQHIQLYADKDKIAQVMVNLLSNAIKYSPKGGTITVGCEVVGSQVKISVTDEGIGISRKDQQKLFDRFYRVENEKIKTVSGFGIGLYLVSEILRYHHSKINVESREGAGSTFYFNLDIAQS